MSIIYFLLNKLYFFVIINWNGWQNPAMGTLRQFKRFLTQETGNGISNYDTKIWEEEIMANPDWFKNYDEADRALQLLEDIFIARRNEIDIGLDFVYDPSNITEDELLKLNKEVGTLSSLRQQEGKIVLQDGKLIRVK